ncbi:MAG: hypothetical protein K2L61_04875 [Clostridia bacterium]|nr:hypothetical protein [Clostridia bacterium]
MSRLTKKNKVTIAVSVFAIAVLLFSIIMFGIWAGVEVYCEKMSYETLQKKFGEHFIVPSGLEDDVLEPCRVYFPKAEPDSNHRYGKYTNLTVKNKYARHYNVELRRQNVDGFISGSKEFRDLSWLLSDGYEITNVNGVDIYFICNENANLNKTIVEICAYFVLDDIEYCISTRAESQYRKEAIEYEKLLFDKFF